MVRLLQTTIAFHFFSAVQNHAHAIGVELKEAGSLDIKCVLLDLFVLRIRSKDQITLGGNFVCVVFSRISATRQHAKRPSRPHLRMRRARK